MNRRKKIIFFTIIALVILAIVWFVYSKNKQQAVRGQNGNVSSLFPFTGTNTTDYGAEPNSGAPTNGYSFANGGNGNGNNGSGNGNGNGNSGYGLGTGNGNGLGTGGGYGYQGNTGSGNGGIVNVLNLNDLQIGSGNGYGLGIGDLGTGGSGGDCSSSGTGCGNDQTCTSDCPSAYYGEISLTVNDSSDTTLTSDGGIAELEWKVGDGTHPEALSSTSCTSVSSEHDWDGSVGLGSDGTGTSTLEIPANESTSTQIRTYTLDCTGIGEAVATVNVSGLDLTSIIPGASINISVATSTTDTGGDSAELDPAGGPVYLNWGVTFSDPVSTSTMATVSCSAESSANDWTGVQNMNGTTTINEGENTTSDIVSNTYTISCTRVGGSTATVNISSPTNFIIPGSSVNITVATSTTSTGDESVELPQNGGNVILNWEVTLPPSYTGFPPVDCSAESSANDWTVATTTQNGTDTVSESQNNGSDIISNTYTISCTHVGDSTATVNIDPLDGTGFGMNDGSITLSVNHDSSADLPYSGGTIELEWAVATSTDNPSPVCSASSTAGDWSGNQTYDSTGTGTSSLFIPENASSTAESQTYTMNCSGIGSSSVIVNTDINPDWWLDRTPGFDFTANGGSDITISSGTPVTLQWDTKEINGGSCIGTSVGTTTSSGTEQFAGWGNTYDYSSEPMTSTDSANLAAYEASSTEDQSELNALLATSTVTTTGTTTSLSTIQGEITTVQGQINVVTASTTAVQGEINAVNANIATAQLGVQTQTNIINTNTTILNSLNDALTTLPPASAGLVIGSFELSNQDDAHAAILSTQAVIDTASATRATLQNNVTTLQAQLADPSSGLLAQQATLQTTSTGLQTTLTGLQTTLGAVQATQVDAQVGTDITKAVEIQNLQHEISVLQGEIDTINGRYSKKYLHLISQGGTIKPPVYDVGTTATTFTETVGLEGSPATGVYHAHGFLSSGRGGGSSGTCSPGQVCYPGDIELNGDDGTDGGVVGDVPITYKRIYILTCTGTDGKVLPPESVTINVDDSGDNGGGGGGSTDASLTFLGNGSTSPSITAGDPVQLTWQVANVTANSCNGTSSGGQFEGWGYSMHRIRHIKKADGTIVDSAVAVMQPGDFEFFTKELLADPGGTPKAPTTDVGTDSQTFSETIPEGVITAARTYTLTCGSLTQSVTINVDNSPTLTFLADGQQAESAATGTTVNLTWDLKNIKGGTCRGTSDGSYAGWGTTYPTGPWALARDGSDPYKGDDNTPTGGLSYGGTPKDPSTDVSAFGQSFSEVIGKDGSISGGIERDYTLTCTGIDGTTILTQTIILNGPGYLNGGGGDTGTSTDNGGGNGPNPLASSANPCDNDLDIKTAQIQLTDLLSTYKTITGYTVNNYGTEGDSSFGAGDFTQDKVPQGTAYNLTEPGTTSIIGDCWSETTDDSGTPYNPSANEWGNVAGATKDGVVLSYLFSDDSNSVKTDKGTHSLAREMYDLLPWAQQWHTGPNGSAAYWGWDGQYNPLPGWKWGLKWGNGPGQDWSRGDGNFIDASDLADEIIIGNQMTPGNSGKNGTIGVFWLSGGGTHLFDTEDKALGGNTGAGNNDFTDTTAGNTIWCTQDNFPVYPVDSSTNPTALFNGTSVGFAKAQDKTGCYGMEYERTSDVNGMYAYIYGRENQYGTGSAQINGPEVGDADTYIDPTTSDTGCGFQNENPSSPNYQRWYAGPLCGPGIFAIRYSHGNDDKIVWYGSGEMAPLGKQFGY